MSNSRRRYRAILTKLVQISGYPTGHAMSRLQVQAAYICGIIGSGSPHGREVAKHSGMKAKVESRVKRLSRWYQNEKVCYELDYLPYIDELLNALAGQDLAIAMDGSDIGRGCMVLMVSLIYNNRAIPLAWVVFERPKGHASAEEHIALLEQVEQILPAESTVIFLSDGEFDSVQLQKFVAAKPNWEYVCRTAKNTLIYADGEWLSLDSILIGTDTCLTLNDVLFTAQSYGPVHVVLRWDSASDEPLYLVTSLEIGEEASFWYQHRMKIETFFSDQKSRGFNLHKSHIGDAKRLTKILIAACLAYIWMIFLGTQAHIRGFVQVIHRSDRCDLSLFQLGLDLLHHLIEEGLDIWVDFSLPLAFFRASPTAS